MKLRHQCPVCFSKTISSQPAILMPFIAWRAFRWKSVEINPSWGLRDFPKGKIVYGCNTQYCHSCRMVFSDIGFDENEMNRLYKNYRGELYNAEREEFEPGYLSRAEGLNQGYSYMSQVEDFICLKNENLNILDWGGGNGFNTPFRRIPSNKIDIIDPGYSNSPYENVRIIEKKSLKDSYELITILNVLEHVPNPIGLVINILELVSARNIYIEVPYDDFRSQTDSNDWKKKRHWHEHINSFSLESFNTLSDNLGFKNSQIRILSVINQGRNERIIQLFAELE